MSEDMKNEAISIWAAIGPNGDIIKSSIGTFKAATARWALKRKNYTVVKLAEIEPRIHLTNQRLTIPQVDMEKIISNITNKRRRRRARAA